MRKWTDSWLSSPVLALSSFCALPSCLLEPAKQWLQSCMDLFYLLRHKQHPAIGPTGRKNGACVLFERMLAKDLLHLSCGHYIYEIMLMEVFLVTMGKSTGPDIGLLKRFKKQWTQLAMDDCKRRMDDDEVFSDLQNVSDNILQFCFHQLQAVQPRDDYRELLGLTIIFLGNVPPWGVHFAKSGQYIGLVSWHDWFIV